MSTIVSLTVEPARPRAPLAPLRQRVYDAFQELHTWNASAIARHLGHDRKCVLITFANLIQDGLIPPRPVSPVKKPLTHAEVAANAEAVRAERALVRDDRDESCHDALPPHPVTAPPDAQATCRKYLGEWRRIKAGKPAPRESNAVHSSLKGADRAGKPHRLHISRAYYRGPEL